MIPACYLVFDAGTQSVKTAVYTREMECIAQYSAPTHLTCPQPGWVEMDPDEYVRLAKEGMAACSAQLKERRVPLSAVRAIMGDGIICGVTGIDAEGKAVTPYINYLDSRTAKEADAMDVPASWGEKTGNTKASCMFPALIAGWLRRNHAEFQKRGVAFVHNAPYILMKLAGAAGTDAWIDWGTLSGWGFGYDLRTKEWDRDALAALGLDSLVMPRIAAPYEVMGRLSKEAAQQTGFPEGIPICAGAGDTMQSLLGCGCAEAGTAVDVAGTCAMLCAATKGVVPGLSASGSLIFNSGTLPDTYFYWGFVRAGGLSLRWFKDNICEGGESEYRRLSERAACLSPGADGVWFIPYLTGGYGEYEHLKASFLNLQLDTDRYTLWRAVLEAIAYEYRDCAELYREHGQAIEELIITEGGSRDALWNQIKADVLHCRTAVPPAAAGALLANAWTAAYAVGDITDLKEMALAHQEGRTVWQPDNARRRRYDELYEARLALRKTLCI